MLIHHLELTNGLIHHARNTEYFAEDNQGAWPLFLSFRFNGDGAYQTNEGHFLIDDDSYLLLNSRRSYSVINRSSTTVESLSIGFWPSFTLDALRTMATPVDFLLDEPFASDQRPVDFIEKTYPYDPAMREAVQRLRFGLHQCAGLEKGWLEEQLHQIFAALLSSQTDLRARINKLPAVKSSTRVELYRRLALAQDYMMANLAEELSLTKTAAVAGFSPYHFLRVFRQTFGTTPHQYLISRRLEKARHLLSTTTESITQICLQVGFTSLGSFSTRFQRQFGCSPQAYRRDQISGESDL